MYFRLHTALMLVVLWGCGASTSPADIPDSTAVPLEVVAEIAEDTAIVETFDSQPLVPDLCCDVAAELDSAPAETDSAVDLGPPPDTDGDGLDDAKEELLGTDPEKWDTDTDGMSDGQEVEEGTDPLDPSSATMWHPEWSEYPRLVFGPESIEQLKQRLVDPPYPVSIAVDRMVADAAPQAMPPKTDSYDPYHEYVRARTAKGAAFMALMNDDPDMAEKALLIASGINANLDEIDFTSPFYSKTDIHAAEAITYYAQAYDFLAGSGLVPQAQLDAMEASVTELVLALEKTCTAGALQFLLTIAQNNHNIKSYTAIGLAGIAFNRSPHSARWVNRGVTEGAYYMLDFLVTEDGGYAEGPSYLAYGAGNFLVFFRAYHRFAKGETFYFRNFYETRDPDGPTYSWVADPAASSLLHSVFLWPLRIMTPDSRAPNFDDSALATLPSGYLAALFEDPRFLWHWEFPAQGHSTSAGLSLAADTFSLWPMDLVPQPPDWPHNQFLPDAGNCALRTGWTADASWVLLMGEHGKMRLNGGGHEHGEAFHLSYWAREEYWLMDGGYINWEEKEKVSQPDNHNLILVDGTGPPSNQLTGYGSDTMLTRFEVQDPWSTCTSSTSYEGVGFSRTALFLPEMELLIVADRITAASQHDYSLLWHGNGGGDSGGDLTVVADGGVYTRGDDALAVICNSTWGQPAVTHAPYPHSVSHSKELSHEALVCAFGGDSGLTLTVAPLGPSESTLWIPQVVTTKEGVARTDFTTISGETIVALAVDPQWAPLTIDLPCGQMEVDTALAVISCKPQAEPQLLYSGAVAP